MNTFEKMGKPFLYKSKLSSIAFLIFNSLTKLFPSMTTLYRILLIALIFGSLSGYGQATKDQKELDEKVQTFLDKNKSKWRDLNVPYEDGKVLYDVIIKNKYTSAVEIGTSTGHST